MKELDSHTTKFKEIQEISKKARIKSPTPFPLSDIGIDYDLTGLTLFVTDIDRYQGIGGSLSKVYVWILNDEFRFLYDYLIPTSFLDFNE